MMRREWKPGDLAVIRVPKSSAPGFGVSEREYADVPAVRNTVGGWNALADPDYFWGADYSFHQVEPRPLVVIDPEDREQVERLRDALWMGGTLDQWQERLREFAAPTPPRPDEPTGLGAVIEDAERRRWVLTADAGWAGPWYCGDLPEDECGDDGAFRHYRALRAARVLSEGVDQ